MSHIDIIYKVSLIIIASFNLIFAIYIFCSKNKKDEKEKEKDIKIGLLKTLVLDHNMKFFYSIFEKMETKLKELKYKELTGEKKKEIEGKISDLFILLRQNFYDALLAIDDTLYDDIKDKSDNLQTHLTETIFNPGINLSYEPKYDELISQEMTTRKTEIIKKLFNYRG